MNLIYLIKDSIVKWRYYIIGSVILGLIIAIIASNLIDNNKYKSLVITWETPIFLNSTGGTLGVKQEDGSWKKKIVNSIGNATKGQKITKVHRIREQRVLVTLDDNRKGWVDLPFLWPSESGKIEARLITDIKFEDIKAEPTKYSNQSVKYDSKRANKRFKRNSNIEVTAWYTDKESYEKNLTAYPSHTWAYIIINEETKGWIPLKYIRLYGQMTDSAVASIWLPIRWISELLGDGFFAGLFVLLLYGIPILIAFLFARFLSEIMKFLPNFILFVVISAIVVPTYFAVFTSVFDASSFNQNSGLLMFLFVLLTGSATLGGLSGIFQEIRESRCPKCKEWEGGAYQRDHLGTTTTTKTTTTTYGDGRKDITSSKDVVEDWKDYCKCYNCGHTWTLYRKEHI